MKNLGLLFGSNLLLETDDQAAADKAERYLANLTKESERLQELRIEEEARLIFKRP